MVQHTHEVNYSPCVTFKPQTWAWCNSSLGFSPDRENKRMDDGKGKETEREVEWTELNVGCVSAHEGGGSLQILTSLKNGLCNWNTPEQIDMSNFNTLNIFQRLPQKEKKKKRIVSLTDVLGFSPYFLLFFFSPKNEWNFNDNGNLYQGQTCSCHE